MELSKTHYPVSKIALYQMGYRHTALLEVGARSAPENFVIFQRRETKLRHPDFGPDCPMQLIPPLFRADLVRRGSS